MAGEVSVSVLAIIPNKRRRVLMTRYLENSDWTLPGGPVRDGESLQQALMRQVRERVGLNVQVGPLFDVHKELDGDAITYFFVCTETGGVLTLSARVTEFAEFSLEDTPSNIDPMVRQRLFSFWRNPAAATPVKPSRLPLEKEIERQINDKETVRPATIAVASVMADAVTQTQARPAPAIEKKLKSRSKRRFLWFGPGLVLIAAGLLYSTTRQGYFLADDFIILNQLHFKQTNLTDNLTWFGRDWGVGVNFYRPWVRLGYFFEYALFGDKAAGWHLFSAGLHACNSLLVWLLAWLLVRRAGVALVAGLVFALQPVHTEPVAWISGQADLWASGFVLASVCAFIAMRQLEKQKRPHLLMYLLAGLCFVMALFSKESAIALPVVLLAYDFVRGGLDRLLNNSEGGSEADKVADGGSLGRLLLYQTPFWLLLIGYFGLRLVLFNGLGGYTTEAGQSPDFGLFLRVNLRWLAYPFGLGGTDGLILVVALGAFLALAGVQEWEYFRLWRGETLDNPTAKVSQGRNAFWSLRTAAFGLIWVAVFVLPTALTPPAERFTYLPSAGFALFVAICLTPFPAFLASAKPRRSFKLGNYLDFAIFLRLSAIGVVLLAYFAVASQRVTNWNEAGNTARRLLEQTKGVIPGVVPYSVFVSQGLPESGDGTLIFRTGYPEAIQLLYNDPSLETRRVARFPIVTAHLDRTIFLQYQGERLINHQEVVQTLAARNDNLKKEKSAQTWDFANPAPGDDANTSRGSWSETSGTGRAEVKNGALEVVAPGLAQLQSPGLNLPAVQLGTLEITLRATPRPGSSKAVYKVGLSWEALPTGEPREFPTIPFEVKADGQYYTYRITPPVAENYNYIDTIAYIRLQIPPELQNVTIQLIRQNSIPISYANLSN